MSPGRFDVLREIESLDRMNWAHAHYTIANDNFLYVLSTFIYEPVRWFDAVGWRPTCRNERLGYYWFWREIGTRMGITGIPDSYETFEAWKNRYEREQFRFTDTNHRVGASTRDLFAAWFPRVFTPIVRYSSTPHFFTDDRNRTHPKGYEISRLGPPKLVAAEQRVESRIPDPESRT